jgi:hypothetical protein
METVFSEKLSKELSGSGFNIPAGATITGITMSTEAKPSVERARLPIDRPCSACSAGDSKMEYHLHAPPFRTDSATITGVEDKFIHSDKLSAYWFGRQVTYIRYPEQQVIDASLEAWKRYLLDMRAANPKEELVPVSFEEWMRQENWKSERLSLREMKRAAFSHTIGPADWHSHVVLYPNGQRTSITLRDGKFELKNS